MMRLLSTACLVSALPLLALAAPIHYHAVLKGGSEVPPTGSAGSGTVDATYDSATGKLAYTVTWSGLTGPATMAHFHGPAPVGKNAGVEIVVGGANPVSPVHADAALTAAQAKMLGDGLMYVNVHSAKFPKGEIRGQVVAE
jgi:hypothetical protein